MSIVKILSLPPSLVGQFNEVSGLARSEWYPTTDPNGVKVGSGGGTAWAISEHLKEGDEDYGCYIKNKKRIIIHAGGQSRRLPSYAPSGKVLTPVPVFGWSRGQKIDQTLLSLQAPLYEQIMERATGNQNTLIASGDVFIYAPIVPDELPDADVVCFGIETSAKMCSNHGVFFTKRGEESQKLDFMLQKPSPDEIERLTASHLFLMDIGVWVMSEKAMNLLMKRCGWNGKEYENGTPDYYDLYSSFGPALGEKPYEKDEEINKLSVAIVTLKDGEFFHYGTSPEIISSTKRIENISAGTGNCADKRTDKAASIFIQNAECGYVFTQRNESIWIENSHIGDKWKLTKNNIITGIPENNWKIELGEGMCLDIVPIDNDKYCIRPYNIGDKFKGEVGDETTLFMGQPFKAWLEARNTSIEEAGIDSKRDIQSAAIFPVVSKEELSEEITNMMLGGTYDKRTVEIWLKTERISADEISARANLRRLFEQRRCMLAKSLPDIAENYKKSIFYQTDLKYTAKLFAKEGIKADVAVDSDEPELTRMGNSMFRSEVKRLNGEGGEKESEDAFKILQKSIIKTLDAKAEPRYTITHEERVVAKSPARLDIAGGWSDTPPYCVQNGGCVVNLAVDLDGQAPIQASIRLTEERRITMRSIDHDMVEEISSYDEIGDYAKVGSVFSIPRAALCLAGFHPDFGAKNSSLKDQLEELGGGMDITLHVDIPKGSGLGTSSILAATLLAALSDCCGLGWTKHQICHRTLILEQMLTTGGGWQDQYGGVFSGIKVVESIAGPQNEVSVEQLPGDVFSDDKHKGQWILYYTGITRVAKSILGEIVRGMFLNESTRLATLDAIKLHGKRMADAIQKSDIAEVGKLLRKSWMLNCALDPGTTTPDVKKVTDLIDDLALGYKLLGAGGGGYLVICAKDAECANKIKTLLTQTPPNERARLVEMSLSKDGLQVSREKITQNA